MSTYYESALHVVHICVYMYVNMLKCLIFTLYDNRSTVGSVDFVKRQVRQEGDSGYITGKDLKEFVWAYL
jgi:hypothetical protein